MPLAAAHRHVWTRRIRGGLIMALAMQGGARGWEAIAVFTRMYGSWAWEAPARQGKRSVDPLYLLGNCSRLMDHTGTPPGRMSPARGWPRGPGGRMTRGRPGLGVLVALLLVPAVVRSQSMRWPEAVAALAGERTRAEDCVKIVKRHASSDAAELSRGQLAYTEAKAEVDAVIAGLIVVLAQGGSPPDLADLEARLTRGVQAREAFCTRAIALIPPDPGTRKLISELVGAFLKPLLEAAVTLYTFEKEQDRLLRQTIQTQLEATQWSAFADIAP
jgi:hypothetical protein